MTPPRIRILLCSSSMEAGGSERQLLYLLQGLDRTQFQPLLYLTYDNGSLLQEVPVDVPQLAFWRDRRLPRWNWPGRIHSNQIQFLRQVILEHQIDLVYDRLFHMTLVTGPATAATGTPRVSTIVSPPQHDLERTEKRWRWFKRRALARAYRNSTALLTVARGTAINASEYYGIPIEQFQVVPSPIDLQRIEWMAEMAPTSMAPGSSKRLLAVGRLSAEKGHIHLLEAMSMYQRKRQQAPDLPLLHLQLAGEGPLRTTLEKRIRALGLEDVVTLLGQVSNPFALMRCCDLFIMPSLYEGMPNAMLEAMALGVPVLASDTEQGPGEFLREHPLGALVPPADPSGLCHAIIDRFRSPEAWIARGLLAQKHVRQHHSLSQWLPRMQSILHRAAKATP